MHCSMAKFGLVEDGWVVELGGMSAWLMGRSVGERKIRGWSAGRKSKESVGDLRCEFMRSVAASRARMM